MAETSPYSSNVSVQRAPNANRNSIGVANMKLSPQSSISMIPARSARPANASGGPMQSMLPPNRQPLASSGQMVAQNRQLIQNQKPPSSQLQRTSQLPAKNPNRKALFIQIVILCIALFIRLIILNNFEIVVAAQKPMAGPSPSQKSTQAVSKIPLNLPAGLSISLKSIQRNNQQQQQRQQPVARIGQIQTEVTRVQSASTVLENTAPKNIASATAPIDRNETKMIRIMKLVIFQLT